MVASKPTRVLDLDAERVVTPVIQVRLEQMWEDTNKAPAADMGRADTLPSYSSVQHQRY